jgi:uncharacterized protein YkwD
MIRTHVDGRRGRVVALLVSAALFLAVAPGAARAAGDYPLRLRCRMRVATNDSRQRYGVATLRLNATLSDIARRHSVAMARAGELFHTSNPGATYLKGMPGGHWWGENVGVTTGTVGEMERMFMGSPPHRANILNRVYRHVAIGAVRVDGKLWVTVFFYS